jgi:hypothetical protein
MKYILIILLVLIVLGWIRRIFFYSMNVSLKKAAEEMLRRQENAAEASGKPEGSVTVQDIRKPGTRLEHGEYTEYEEVK